MAIRTGRADAPWLSARAVRTARGHPHGPCGRPVAIRTGRADGPQVLLYDNILFKEISPIRSPAPPGPSCEQAELKEKLKVAQKEALDP